MASTSCSSKRLCLFFSSFLFFLPSANSAQFKFSHFNLSNSEILYLGDAKPSDGVIEFNQHRYICRIGSAIYAENVLIWDSRTGKLTDFSTHYSFIINTEGAATYGSGLAFFLAPVGFHPPYNSAGGYLGLFNPTVHSSHNQIVHVEFDSFSDPRWDPPMGHVGINNNSLSSSVYTCWNASIHSGDITDVWITYNATTKNLSVSWQFQNTSTSQGSTSLSYHIDLTKVLPEWVKIGFSASTGTSVERHALLSWEFNSTLEMSDISEDNTFNTKLADILLCSWGLLFIFGVAVAYAILWRQNIRKREATKKMNLTALNDYLDKGAGPRRFFYKELVFATDRFSNERKLGQGGFGAVYRGYLAHLEMAVAVKKTSRDSRQGRREYEAEVKIVSRLRHRNLVQLIGCCHERGEFLLVYEFMPNGSLDSHLFGKKAPLAWSVRYKVALGLASALIYLHEEWEQCVVHRDIKSSNVMLDSNFNVKLGDFGLAKLMDHELGYKTTMLAGTLGYLAPEYLSTGRASKESDVYSFGVVIFEIATGRKAVDLMGDKDGEKGLVEWVWDYYGRGELLMAMDERLKINFDEEQVECLMMVGLWCAHPDRKLRPSIRQALQVLCFEAAMPSLSPKMPVAIYRASTSALSLHNASITTSFLMGR